MTSTSELWGMGHDLKAKARSLVSFDLKFKKERKLLLGVQTINEHTLPRKGWLVYAEQNNLI